MSDNFAKDDNEETQDSTSTSESSMAESLTLATSDYWIYPTTFTAPLPNVPGINTITSAANAIDSDTSSLQRWYYPALDMSINATENSSNNEDIIIENSSITSENKPEKSTAEEALFEERQNLIEKINFLDLMAIKLQENLDDIDANLLNDTLSLVKKVTKKILLKELDVDKNCLNTMISDALLKINNDSCVIKVSTDDFSFFESNEHPFHHLKIEQDSTLIPGDFKINTPVSALESILESRLNMLLGL